MKRETKHEIANELSQTLAEKKNFYIADVSTLTVNETNQLRRKCFEKGISIQMVKNTLIRKALQDANINADEFSDVLRGPSSVMISENVNAPAKLIKEFRKTHSRPVLKAAYIEESLYVGDDKIDTLVSLKSREELIADIVALLKSPMQNVISGLQGGGHKIAGILKTLSEKES